MYAIRSYYVSGIKNRKNVNIIIHITTSVIVAIRALGTERFPIFIFLSRRTMGCPRIEIAPEMNMYATIDLKNHKPKTNRITPMAPIIYFTFEFIILF